MPNWVTNEMEIRGTNEQVQVVLDYIRSTDYDGAIDFNRIIPQPECIKKCPNSGREARTADSYFKIQTAANRDPIRMFEDGFLTREMLEQQESWESYRKEPDPKIDAMFGDRFKVSYKELMLNYLHCMKETGCVDWYDWNCKYWGTKWNACDSTVDGNVVTFDTAWSDPEPIFVALATKFKDVAFIVESANEDYDIPVTKTKFKWSKKTNQVEQKLLETRYREYPDDDYEDEE